MNDTHITVTGWVGTTPERREVAGGAVVTSFRVAHQSRRLKDGEWSDGPTTWYTVKAWRRLAEHVAASIGNGDPVVVRGRLVADVWTREDGATVSQYVLVASSVGHDLTHGTSRFAKAERPAGETAGPRGEQPEEQPAERSAEQHAEGHGEQHGEQAA